MKSWPADKVLRRRIDGLEPYPKNARVHTPAQIGQIAKSIQAYGFTVPVLTDEAGRIIAGHGRVEAAKALGLDDVPTVTAEGWSEAQRRAYTILDNKLTLNAAWDEAILGAEFAELEALGFDLGDLAFSPPELALIRDSKPVGLTDPDDAPDAPAEPIATTGDLWALGRHRLLCGDATKAEDAQKLFGGAKPHLMVTDPPYGVDYDPRWRLESGINKPHQKRAEGRVSNDDRADWRDAWILFEGDVAYVWHGALHSSEVAESLKAAGFQMRSQIIWAKSTLVIGRGHYHWQHEPCWYSVRQKSNWRGDHKQSTLWQIQNMHRTQGNVDDGKTPHSAQKPVECMRRPIENNSQAGDAVYDPFVGSGTTIIAAEMTARQCYAIEINPAYIDVAIVRWQNFSGKEAKLGDETFAQVAERRRSNEAWNAMWKKPFHRPEAL
jgi:DNA modification methylase